MISQQPSFNLDDLGLDVDKQKELESLPPDCLEQCIKALRGLSDDQLAFLGILSEEQEMELKLGEFICEANPYVHKARVFADQNPKLDGRLPPNRKPSNSRMITDTSVAETDTQPTDWNFKRRPNQVAWMARIPYTYIDEMGLNVTEHLLIGFEGSYTGP